LTATFAQLVQLFRDRKLFALNFVVLDCFYAITASQFPVLIKQFVWQMDLVATLLRIFLGFFMTLVFVVMFMVLMMMMMVFVFL